MDFFFFTESHIKFLEIVFLFIDKSSLLGCYSYVIKQSSVKELFLDTFLSVFGNFVYK